jgi:DNA-binding NarL/FixJ family response regulator
MTKANLKNPFGLTARECEVMESMCRLGKSVLVARDLGVKPITVQEYMARINNKMCVENSTLAAIKWDRQFRDKSGMEREAMQFKGARPANSVFDLARVAQ